jgi:hypothetical protein
MARRIALAMTESPFRCVPLVAAMIVAMLGGCTRSVNGAPCPCASGWTCCKATNICLPKDSACPGEGDGDGDGDGGLDRPGPSAETGTTDTSLTLDSWYADLDVHPRDEEEDVAQDGKGTSAETGTTDTSLTPDSWYAGLDVQPPDVEEDAARDGAGLPAEMGATDANLTLDSWHADLDMQPPDVEGERLSPDVSLPEGVPITVIAGGTGSGSITSDPPGIDCDATCRQTFGAGSVVTLIATADANSTFTGWTGGGCSGIGDCVVTATVATTATATFEVKRFTFTVAKTGAGTGTVTSSPMGVDCGTRCAVTYNYGTIVTLTALPDDASDFTGWSGDCSGTTTCSVTIDGTRSVAAAFAPKMRALTVTKIGDGSGTVTVTPNGNICTGSACAYSFPNGTSVSLAASAPIGSSFEGWSGAGCSGNGGCAFVITEDTNVSATFTSTSRRTLTVNFAGNTGGSVLVLPAGSTLTATGSLSIPVHETVTLTATPDANMGFAGWQGPCSGLGACSFVLDGDTTVTVQFDSPNKAFVTSKAYIPGILGGLSGADAKCAAHAAAAGLTGTFRAFLGSSAGTAWTRIRGFAGWARTDGKPFGDQVSDLEAGRTFYPLTSDETGTEIPAADNTLVVTAYLGQTGGDVTTTCNDWSSTISGSYAVIWGEPRSGGLTFALSGGTSCDDATTRLYCFEVTKSVSLRPPVPASARYAFQSALGGNGALTLTAADAGCQAEATSAGLSGNFLAMLAGNGSTAASRFSATGAPWYRPDNVQLSANAADLLGGTKSLWAALSTSADAKTQELYLVWTGAATVATAGTAESTCAGWTSATGTASTMTYGIRMGATWFGPFSNGNCSDQNRLFCFQQ